MSQAGFQKRQREQARQERAAAKAARRDERREQRPVGPSTVNGHRQADVLAELAALHQQYDAGAFELEAFLAARDDLTRRLVIE